MEKLSDTQIRANLRSVMNHHHVDLTKTSFVCTRGVVRMVGELEKQQAYSSNGLTAGDVEALERDLSGMRGVVRVHMEFKNWLRQSSGSWSVREAKRRQGVAEEDLPALNAPPTEEEILKSLTETRMVPVDAYFASKRRRDRLAELDQSAEAD